MDRNRHQRPLGLTIIALYAGAFGLMSLPVGCVALGLGAVPGVQAAAGLLGVVATVLGVLQLATAYGVWTRQQWGRRLATGVFIGSITIGGVGLLGLLPAKTFGSSPVVTLLGVAIETFFVIYLLQPDVKAWFPEAHKGYTYETLEAPVEYEEEFPDLDRREPH